MSSPRNAVGAQLLCLRLLGQYLKAQRNEVWLVPLLAAAGHSGAQPGNLTQGGTQSSLSSSPHLICLSGPGRPPGRGNRNDGEPLRLRMSPLCFATRMGPLQVPTEPCLHRISHSTVWFVHLHTQWVPATILRGPPHSPHLLSALLSACCTHWFHLLGLPSPLHSGMRVPELGSQW